MKLFNPSKNDIEFLFSGQPNIIRAGETKDFSDKVADHCLRFVNSPIVKARSVDTSKDEYVVEETPSFESMSWTELRRYGKGIYKLGMNREELLRLLKNV